MTGFLTGRSSRPIIDYLWSNARCIKPTLYYHIYYCILVTSSDASKRLSSPSVITGLSQVGRSTHAHMLSGDILQRYQKLLDDITRYRLLRWIVACLLVLAYIVRVYFLQVLSMT